MRSVCIDPGHGGIDPGTIGPNGLRESDINLAVALQVAQLIRSKDVNVKLTRYFTFVPWQQNMRHPAMDLSNRCAIANETKADIFLSIHCGEEDHSSNFYLAQGTETFCYQRGNEGHKLACCVHTEVVRGLGLRDLGVNTANLQVLRNIDIPSALVKLAFIRNPHEEEFLAFPENQDKAAIAIAKGICTYFNTPFVVPPPVPLMTLGGETIVGKILDDNKLYVVAREACDLLGYSYEWNVATKTLVVKEP